MPKRIFFDGLNLALPRGTGIATYTRVLAQVARNLGHQTGVLYSSRRKPSRDPMLREIGFFDERRVRRLSQATQISDFLDGQVRSLFPAKTVAMPLNGVVIARQFENQLPDLDHRYLAHRIFEHARYRFDLTGNFTPVDFDVRPDIMHCTYQLPLRAKAACNIYTIHDLVPLRLPFTTLDNKRQSFDLLKKIGAEADHIVTVSESSRRDIIDILGVDEKRVTNTYESVSFPDDPRSDEQINEQLSGVLGLASRGYLLFFGALEPKKNVGRIIDAYLMSGADIPLVLVTSQGWGNETEIKRLAALKENQDASARRRIIHYEYVSRAMLITLIRGARAVLFPSLYEGFGLPVLEAMALGTPVLTSDNSSLTEVAGNAALMVDPYETADIARGITTITHDADLRAELVQRGRVQAAFFSLPRYQARMEELYAKLFDVRVRGMKRKLGPEAASNLDRRIRQGIMDLYLSGTAVLDIGFRGEIADADTITPAAIGIDLNYPGYDGRTLPFADASQDAVFASHVLEHITDWRQALSDWFRVLKIGGFLVIAVPHRDLYERKAAPPSIFNDDHKRFYSPASLLSEIEAAIAVASYRVRLLHDVDDGFDYTIPPGQHAAGSYEIELVIEKIAQPAYADQLRIPQATIQDGMLFIRLLKLAVADRDLPAVDRSVIQRLLGTLPLPAFATVMAHLEPQTGPLNESVLDLLRPWLAPSIVAAPFDEEFYFARYPDIQTARAGDADFSPHLHFIHYGYFEGRFSSAAMV